MRKFASLGLLLGTLSVAGGLAWLLFYSPAGETVRVEIPSGASASGTASLLRREGVIRSVRLFKVCAKLTHLDRSLKPGRYAFRRGMPVVKVLRLLHEGATERIKVVVPEGFMARQIADRLEALGVAPSAGFMAYVQRNNLEGYLFPETYLFDQGLTPERVAHHMHMEFRRLVEPEFRAAGQTRFTLRQVVTLASIVQREARLSSEMPMIAAVYQNRLRKRIRLEADPTVQYALGRTTGQWKKGLTYADLRFQSPYNTYANFGLPPGPICSPGLDAVRAVLHPAETEAIYFVADNTGGHAFTSTLDEHNKAKRKAKRERLLQQK